MGSATAIFFHSPIGTYHSITTVLFQPILTIITFPAAIHQAADTGEVAGFEFFYMITNGGNPAHYFMTGYYWKYCHTPFIAGCVQIAVANAAV